MVITLRQICRICKVEMDPFTAGQQSRPTGHVFEFLQCVEDELKDHYDIKVSWRGAHMAHLERVRSR